MGTTGSRPLAAAEDERIGPVAASLAGSGTHAVPVQADLAAAASNGEE